jgi:hypothetical protein
MSIGQVRSDVRSRGRKRHRQRVKELNLYKLLSFDVYGTLVNMPPINAKVLCAILRDANARRVNGQAFYRFWERRKISHYLEAYVSYKEICKVSLQEAFEHTVMFG